MSGRVAPRPKRGGEEFSRTRAHNDGNGSSKKPRFDVRNPSALAPDAVEEDAVLEADEIGKRGQQAKRNAVNIDGYDSDSSNDGFDARADMKLKEDRQGKGAGGSKEDAENDMFADPDESMADGDEDEEGAADGKKKKADVRFVDVDEIEGQVAGSKSGGHVSTGFAPNENGRGKAKEVDKEVESSTDSEVDDEVRAEIDADLDEEIGAGGKKKHAPKLDAFNLHAEKEDGGFDEQLNYVRKAVDPDAVHDTWLQGVSKKEMKKAKDAQDKRDQERRQKILEDDSVLTSNILKTLIPFLEPAETILEALARLGTGKEKKRPKWQNKNKNKKFQEMDDNAKPGPENPAELRRREAVEAITGAADLLLTRGQPEIYDLERELLMRQYKRETGEDWIDTQELAANDVKQWKYRWSDARDGGEAHGPYEGSTMVAWNDAGYFGEGVEFRRVENQEGEWSSSVDFL